MTTTLERPTSSAAGAPPVRADIGPVLSQARLPMASMTLSAIAHVGVAIAAFVALTGVSQQPKKPMVVQLVPAVAALGSPRGEVTAPRETTPRPEPVAPKPDPARAKEPPPVKAPAVPAPPPLAAAVLPARERPRETFTPSEPTPLPDRTHAAALPRFERRETPALPAATATPASNPLPLPLVAKAPPPSATSAATPRALGRGDGSPRGAGLVTVDGDFPWAWYIAAIQRKISEQWQEKALPGQQPTIVFEIGRDGQVRPGQLTVEKSSGNARYDRTALSAIESARPFPPLPADFQHALLRINVSFAYLRE